MRKRIILAAAAGLVLKIASTVFAFWIDWRAGVLLIMLNTIKGIENIINHENHKDKEAPSAN